MKEIAIIYGSSTDNTKTIAKKIADKLSGENVTLIDASDLTAEDIDKYLNLILGTSTWGLGDLQDDWEGSLCKLEQANLAGKVIAFFGLGDSGSYPDTFVDGMGILYEAIVNKGAKIVGQIPTHDYSYDVSRAEVDGNFVGVALDEDNESDKTESRLENWLNIIRASFQ